MDEEKNLGEMFSFIVFKIQCVNEALGLGTLTNYSMYLFIPYFTVFLFIVQILLLLFLLLY